MGIYATFLCFPSSCIYLYSTVYPYSIVYDVENFQMHLGEIRLLKEELRKTQNENREIKEMCCFLDEDRQRTRTLSREWQKFGRYTSSVMKQVHNHKSVIYR